MWFFRVRPDILYRERLHHFAISLGLIPKIRLFASDCAFTILQG